MQDENKFEQKLTDIKNSSTSDDEKIFAVSNLIAGLNSLHNSIEICSASEIGIVIARNAGRPEMAAQFYLMRSKAEIAQLAPLIKEMKELTMAIEWFDFALESEKKRYKDLNTKLQVAWKSTQSMIDMGYKLLNEKPYVGAVAFCHRTAGEIYGAFYLQLKLYYFVSGRPWRSRIGNFTFVKWLGMDDLFIMSKKSRKHLRSVKKDCIRAIHKASRMFKQEKSYDYMVESYFDLALEHHSFNDPIRSKFYLYLGWFLMKWYKLNEPRLKANYESLKKFPLIGSNRKEDDPI